MNPGALDRFAQWIYNTEGSTALRESLLVYPIIETTHVATLTLFVGLIAIMDLRLLGLTLKAVPVSDIVRRILPWALLGFAVSVTSGLLLFYSTPVRMVHNVFFRYKLVALLLAGVNAGLFHTGIYKRVAEWDRSALIPRRVKVAGAISLALWASIVVSGRMIAYNWFDCDKPQPGIVTFLAGCGADTAAGAAASER